MSPKQAAGNHNASCEGHRHRLAKVPVPGFLSDLANKQDVIQGFVPSWFTVTMGTGSVAISISQFPFTFTGQQGIAWAIWWLNILLFILFSCLLLGRILLYSNTLQQLLKTPSQSLFLGAIPMSFSTISNGVLLLWAPRSGSAAAVAADVMFWINLPAVLGCILLVPLSMFTAEGHDDSSKNLRGMSAVWLMPVIPACVAANAAGVVAAKLDDAQQAITVVLTGVCLLGIGLLLSYQICSIYYSRLTFDSLPAKEVIVSCFLPVGPNAMTAWAFTSLALAGASQFPSYAASHPSLQVNTEWLDDIVLPSVVASSGILSLFLWGYATWWLALAVCCVAATVRHGIPFNLGWWGAVFPVGVYTGATIQLGQVLHSQVFTVFGAISVCLQVLLWLCVLLRTCGKAWTGDVFHAPCLTRPRVASLRVYDSQGMEEVDIEMTGGQPAMDAARDLDVQLARTVGSFCKRGDSSGGQSLDSVCGLHQLTMQQEQQEQ